MKKVFSVIVTIVLLVCMISVASAEEGVIVLTGTCATRGNLVDVRVYVKGTADTLIIVPEYDKDAFLLYEVKDNVELGESKHGKNVETGKYQLKWEECGNVDTTVAVLTFLVKGNAEIKNYAFTASAEGFKVAGGFVGVTEEPHGDVTGDGTLDEEDVESLRKYSASWNGYNESRFLTGDVNGDGKVDLADAVIIARIADGWDGYLIDGERENTPDEIPIVESDCDEG